jgi:amidase
MMASHTFAPDHYYNAFGTYEPVLHIVPGDTVATSTIDAAGVDAGGRQAATRGNPLTGPFYVEGAEPGDTLAVYLERLAPSRDTGYTRAVVAEHVVDATYVRELPTQAEVTWHIDRTGLTATLPGSQASSDIVLPLAPMLGCLGVAPHRNQAISSATAGPHGGNMDYNGFVTGVTAYFPVFVAGALLFVGDGHAVQGDGEIVGTGIETSFDVQFTVRLIKGKRITWPRGENDDYIFTLGNARPLDQALQHATTEMLRSLQEDHGFDPLRASTFLGQCVEYQIGNVFDPAYTVVCKVRKSLLARLSPPS